jgi:hypothetical protein
MAWPRYEEIVFIYESKFNQATKEFVVQYNPDLIAPMLEGARFVDRALERGRPPARPLWAEDADSKVCKSCEYRRTCWQLGAKSDDAQTNDPKGTVRVQRTTAAKRRKHVGQAPVRPA